MPMSPRLLRPRATGTSAPLFPGIGGWWDATDSSSYTLETGVSEWRDKSGQGQAFRQTNTTNQPTINATGIGGKPALQFNGSNRWLDLGSQTIGGNNLLTPANNPWSIYLVCKSDQGSALVRTLFGKGFSQVQLGQITTSYLASVNGGGPSIPDPAASLPANVDGVFGFEWNGSRARGFFNQNTGTSTLPAGTVEATNIALGVRNIASPTQPWSGFVGEVVFYNRVLSLGEQANLFSYMNAKWGVSITAYSPPAYADADVNAYLTAVETVDGRALETGVRDAINDFIVGCKADGIWSAIKAGCILCGARTLAGALTPLKGPAPTNNGPFVAADYVRGGATPGLIGNGSTKFLASNRASNADPQNDFHMGCWVSVLPNNLTTINAHYMGTLTSAFTLFYNIASGTPRDGTACRSTGTGAFGNNQPVVAGFRGMARASSTTFTNRFNNVTNTATDTSAAPTSSDLNVFGVSGTSNFRNDGRFAFYSIGTSLNLALLNSRVSTLVAAMANVT